MKICGLLLNTVWTSCLCSQADPGHFQQVANRVGAFYLTEALLKTSLVKASGIYTSGKTAKTKFSGIN